MLKIVNVIKHFKFDFDATQNIVSETVRQTISIKWSLYHQIILLTSSNFY